jgi:hypothetical protein
MGFVHAKLGSGFGLDPDSIRSLGSDPDPDSGGQKLRIEIGKNLEISCFEVLDVLF